jgi:CHAD domain-containing protein
MERVEPVAPLRAPGAGRLLGRRARDMFRVFPRALVGETESVHDLRVAARRLRMALALLATKPDGRRARRANRALRALVRAAGRGRDLDVGAALLDSGPSPVDEGHRRLRRALVASRSRARVLAREALLDLDVAGLRRDLRRLASSAQLTREALDLRLETVRRREQEAIASELDAPAARPDPRALHAARRSARRLRYAEEVSALFDGATPGDAAARWRGVQRLLGEINDRHVLAAWLHARAGRAESAGDVVLAAAAQGALARVRKDAQRKTREFLVLQRSEVV